MQRIDLSAFAPAEESASMAMTYGPLDGDGLVIPALWQPVPAKWARLAIEVRRKLSARFVEDEVKRRSAPAKPLRGPRPGATRFSTQCAADYARRRGWKVLDRERYDARLKRHHDIFLVFDLLCDDGGVGLLAIQSAGRGERKEHFARFEQAGGIEKFRRRCIRCLYLEFERGAKEPSKIEWWA